MIDIILPYYNGSKYIEAQLSSIEANVFPENCNYRIIIIDDHSSQEERLFLDKILPSYKNIYLSRNEQNLGVVKTVEKGLSISTAPFVMLCDQDDIWLPGKIKVTIAKIQSISGPALTFTDLKIVDESLTENHSSMFRRFGYEPKKIRNGILIQNMVTGCTVGLNRDLIKVALPFPEHLLIHDHWLAICATYSGVIEVIPEQTILYRQHSGNQIGARYESLWSKLLRLRSKFEKKHQHHILKANQALQLATRLKERNIPEHVKTLECVASSLKAEKIDDLICLLREKVLTFTSFREIAIMVFFLIVSSYKQLKR